MTGQELTDAFLKYLDGKHPPRAPANQAIAMLFGQDEVQLNEAGTAVVVPGIGAMELDNTLPVLPEWASWYAISMDAQGWHVLAGEGDPFLAGAGNPLPQNEGVVYAVPAGFFPPKNPAFTDPVPAVAGASRQTRRAAERAARKDMARKR